MDDWSALRIAVVVVAWLTVAGGITLAVTWVAVGGGRGYGPEDELLAKAGVDVERGPRPIAAFSSAQVGIHALLGIMTAALVTYAAARSDDRPTGYVAGIVAIAVTATPGLLMFRKWRSSRRPVIPGVTGSARGPKVEDRLPKAVVYLHGLAAATIVVLLVLLLVVD
jgi:hypothetical protein